MSHPKPTSPAVRKIRAKLRNYTRPFVWGSVVILGLLTLLIWEFSNNPERFYLLNLEEEEEELEVGNEAEGLMEISPEDSAIAADIDSSAVLLNDLNQQQPLPQIPLSNPRNFNGRSPSTRSQPNRTQSAPKLSLEGSPEANPNPENLSNLPELSILPPTEDAASESEALPELSILGVPTPPENSNGTPPPPGNRLGIYSGGVNNFETPDLSRLPVSPLQSAMDRLYSSNNSTRGDRNSDPTEETQGRESTDNPQARPEQGSTPQRASNQQSSGENRPNTPQNSANTGSQTSPNSARTTPQPTQTPNGTPQNAANPYGNSFQPGANNPYGTPLTSPTPYGNTPQPAQIPNRTPGTLPNSYSGEESRATQPSVDPSQPIAPRLPGEISPSYTVDYSEDYSNPNNYQPLPATPLAPNSNPTNAYDYLLRSGGQPVPLAPPAPTAAPSAPNNLGTARDLTPNSEIYESPSNPPVGNTPAVSPGVQPLNPPTRDRPSPSSLNPGRNVPTSEPLNPPSVQSPQVDTSSLNLKPDTPTVQPIQPIQPFSVPNSVPGRHIGGGKINTFSNP